MSREARRRPQATFNYVSVKVSHHHVIRTHGLVRSPARFDRTSLSAREIPLAFPKVYSTNPRRTSSRFASRTSFRKLSSRMSHPSWTPGIVSSVEKDSTLPPQSSSSREPACTGGQRLYWPTPTPPRYWPNAGLRCQHCGSNGLSAARQCRKCLVVRINFHCQDFGP